MAYQARVLRALISCPSDVDLDDVRAIQTAIGRWNVLLGEQFRSTMVPVHWSEHAAAAFGAPPQQILNEQLVDTVDVGIAIFWSRLAHRPRPRNRAPRKKSTGSPTRANR